MTTKEKRGEKIRNPSLQLLRIWSDEKHSQFVQDINFEGETRLPYAILFSEDSILELKTSLKKGSPMFVG